MIRYANIIKESTVDGPGIRLVAFLQGCNLCCEGCHNPSLQPLGGGIMIEEEEFAVLLLKGITSLHAGITFSGGEPTLQADALCRVIKIIKKARPELNIWVYTGRTFESLIGSNLLQLIDVLVDGPFIKEKRSLALPFRGSANQRIIDIKEFMAAGNIVELYGR